MNLAQMIRRLTLVATFFLSAAVFANTPTQEQINQFKNLPQQQQRMLAAQLGFDYAQIQSLINSTQQQTGINNQTGQAVYPRGTIFDENGNPISEQQALLNEQFLKKEDEELKPFGYELFANAPSTFAPVFDAPVPANYILGPGDTVNIQLYGKQSEFYELQVQRDGSVNVPELGPIAVAGMSFSELKVFLPEQIKKQIIGIEASVTLGELRSMRVFVLGEAYKPGAYTVSSLTTMTHALFVSGGVSENASLRKIQLKRAGQLVSTLDLYDLLNKGDTANDSLLQPGDVVFIPQVEDTITIEGAVRRPAIYELKDEKNLKQVLELAGPLPDAYLSAVNVTRVEKGMRTQRTLSTNENTSVVTGDHIVVPKASEYVADSVTLIGAVTRPGRHQWQQGLMLSDILGNRDKDLLQDADLTYVLVLRENPGNGHLTSYQRDLTDIYRHGADSEYDLALNAKDRVLVFSLLETQGLTEKQLDEYAFSESQLQEQDKEKWEKTIEDKLFWQKVGLKPEGAEQSFDEEQQALMNQSLIELTDDEKSAILEFKDYHYFSRKRLLAPVIAKLSKQAGAHEPVQLVEVSGQVKYPGVYPLVKNADISGLIKAAGGLTESAFLSQSEITRTSITNTGSSEIQHIEFSPNKVLSGEESLKIVSRDRINIFKTPEWQEELKVTVEGEVAFPGEYTIKRGETLSQFIQRVGGVTEFGNPAAAIFTRESLKEQERKNIIKLTEDLRKEIASEGLRRSSGAGAMVSYSEAKKLLQDLTKVTSVGRLVIDLESLLAGNIEKDVSLENGDTLVIPKQSNTVNVIGEVYVPTSHMFQRDMDYEDYILQSGGAKELADLDKTYIIRANGSVVVPGRDSGFWFASGASDAAIRPGDTVVVPFDSAHMDNMTLWTSVTQIIYQLAVAAAAVGSL